jgi:hypothetical protein
MTTLREYSRQASVLLVVWIGCLVVGVVLVLIAGSTGARIGQAVVWGLVAATAFSLWRLALGRKRPQ